MDKMTDTVVNYLAVDYLCDQVIDAANKPARRRKVRAIKGNYYSKKRIAVTRCVALVDRESMDDQQYVWIINELQRMTRVTKRHED